MTLLVNNGASGRFVDDSNLDDEVEGRLHHYAEPKQSRGIRTAGTHVPYSIATGCLNGKLVGADGHKVKVQLPIMAVPRLGRHQFSSSEAQGKDKYLIIHSTPCLQKGKLRIALQRDRTLFTLSYDMAAVTKRPVHNNTFVGADTLHR